MLAERDPGPQLWISPGDAARQKLAEGDVIRVYNDCGSFVAKAHITAQKPTGVVWMRDGCLGLNRVASGRRVFPNKALGLFNVSVGRAEYEALVEVETARQDGEAARDDAKLKQPS